MAAKDFELILRVQADLQTAVQQLRTLNDSMRVVKSGAQEASGGLQSLTNAARGTENAARGMSTQLRGIGESTKSLASNFGTLAKAFVTVLAIREMAGFVKSVIDANSQLGDMAQKVGVSTEALSALGGVAKRNGSDIDAVKVAFVNLAKAATGGSAEGVKALQAMGISLKQFRDLSPAQQFDLVAQKFAGYEDGANKAALAVALLGRTGADLIPTLNQVGNEGLQNLTDKAIAAGTAVGTDAVNASQKFNNALEDLKGKLRGAVNEGLVQLTPEIEHLSELFKDPQFKEGIDGIADAIAALVIKAGQGAGIIAQFVGNAREVMDFAQTGGAVYSPATRQIAQNQFDGDLAELSNRGNDPNSLNEKSARLRRGVFTWSDSQTRAALKSTDDLLADMAKHAQDIARYDNSTKAPNAQAGDTRGLFVGLGPGKTKAPVIDRSDAAEKLAQQAAKAQDDLTQALIRLQGQLDPTAAAYAAYNATVKQANDNAELAKKNRGADAAAIDTQRDAVIALAASVRDAALDQIAEKDRQAWEALKRSFETPAQVAVDDALKKIAQLNDLLKKGVIDSAQYHDALAKIGTASVTNAPQYSGPGSSVGGPFGELMKNFQAGNALEAWYQQQLDDGKAFHAKDAAEAEVHAARMLEIDRQYQEQKGNIDQSRQQLELSSTAGFFDQIAQLSSSHNKKIAAIGKAASIASTLIKAYQSGTEARAALSGIPIIGPALGIAAEVAAIAAGLANVAQMRSQSVGGYSEGGMTPPGGKYQVAGVVHAGEGVLSQRDVAALGGPAGFNAWRRSLRGFADGGFVHPLANAPTPAQMGFQAPAALPVGALARTAGNDSGAAPPPVGIRIINGVDDAYIRGAMSSAEGETVIMNVLGRNQTKLKQMVR